jgi:diguanylate cyclase (GGDEF)-like protein
VTDELTSLGNRRYLFDVLETLFADTGQPTSQHLAFLFVDLDRFKEVNDSFGHPAGDALLRQLGPRLRRVLRDSDVVVRLGGDEFAIVLLDGGAEYAVDVALRVAASIEERFVLEHMSARISASIGIALAPDHANDAAGLLRCADVAMYRAKLSGRTVAVFDHDLDDGGNLLELADELREAVADDSFVLHFQPQLDLRTRDVCGYEALVRWRHPRLGLLPPSKFLALAEEAGLMPSLTSWVLDEALAQAAAWMADGRPSAVSVNVSATNLLDANFSGLVRELLRQHRVPATELVLEITETCIISDYGRSRAVIEELSDLGVIMSIDDFGAGFTALAYLADLAVGELKLDRTFISGLAAGGRDRDLVRSTIGLGHALGLRVVAEGAEDSATLELLAELGCDRAQGYIIGRPHPSRTVHSCRAASISPSSAVGRL